MGTDDEHVTGGDVVVVVVEVLVVVAVVVVDLAGLVVNNVDVVVDLDGVWEMDLTVDVPWLVLAVVRDGKVDH